MTMQQLVSALKGDPFGGVRDIPQIRQEFEKLAAIDLRNIIIQMLFDSYLQELFQLNSFIKKEPEE